jgi:DNA-binding transcriptional MerR regulator
MSLHSIGAVERDTGIKRDTLRVWERRYGFPLPVRNDKGERLYPEEQLRQLQRIRRLLDQGCRAGKLLPPDDARLNELESNLLAVAPSDPDIESILEAVKNGETEQVIQGFSRLYKEQGLEDFVMRTIAPLVQTVGERWARGELDVYEEHYISQQLIRFLNAEIAKIQITAKEPKVLLATLPGEEHTLGLLMVSAMLSAKDITTINLGSEVPMDQIKYAADKFCVDTVGMTFSGAYQYNQIRNDLIEMRNLIPEDVDIWVGGEGVRRLRKLPEGVTKFKSLDNLMH